ncbi:hypothetical protein BDV96DRAFT_338508 [Lophiotrema nucula]|uniref:Uncharacterized protein n=1 Tax=Lophiotrema nucula TaxID=690887 RepID=A0A6A5YFS4_9PLEO|nr:hypothetical protein BDV96DRAFT_338508 [Lophiotrema nucula]
MEIGAKIVGARLLAEVEGEGLVSLLSALRELKNAADGRGFFGVGELDGLIPASNIAGQNAAIIIIDPLSHFSVHRLAEVMSSLLLTKMKEAGKAVEERLIKDMTGLVKMTLVHIHVFRPQSWDSLLSTLKSLPDYLFSTEKHRSMNRRIHTLALEDIDTFYWSLRSSSSNATPAAATSQTNSVQAASIRLTRHLLDLSNLLSCATILTSHSSSPTSFRPFVPTSWPQGIQPTRLAVRRVEVLKFVPAICIEDAERERQQRWEVVQQSRFEAWKVGIGAKDGTGFVFKIAQGIEIEKEGP